MRLLEDIKEQVKVKDSDSMPKDENPTEKQLVTLDFCNERFNRILDKLTAIDQKVTSISQKQEESKRDWKMFILSILSGTVVALVTWALYHLR